MAFPLEFLLESVILPSLMGKHKKKHSKKDDLSEDILDAAAVSIKKFRKVTKEIGKLSTGQKIVGGLALAAAGLVFLASNEDDGPAKAELPAASSKSSEAAPADDASKKEDNKSSSSAPAARKPRKSTKSKFSTEHE
jgi:hypothetical protein